MLGQLQFASLFKKILIPYVNIIELLALVFHQLDGFVEVLEKMLKHLLKI
jgi:hypothetical protein